jgi:broad specificity phosphatase PhoE
VTAVDSARFEPVEIEAPMADIVMLIRHAEKPAGDGPPFGVTDQGAVDHESLTPRGWQRAGALVGYFGSKAAPGMSGLPVPTHLFASQVGPQSSSRRPLETVKPLADRLGLTVDAGVLKADVARLAEAIHATDGIVLVSWEHHLIPSLAAALTGEPSLAPAIWPDDRFDLVWVFERDPGQSSFRFRQVTQGLLAGDLPPPNARAEVATEP